MVVIVLGAEDRGSRPSRCSSPRVFDRTAAWPWIRSPPCLHNVSPPDPLSQQLIGRPGGRIPVERFADYDQAILQVVRDEEGLSDLPIVTCVDFGHTDPMMVLPLGVYARIDAEGQRVEIIEPATV